LLNRAKRKTISRALVLSLVDVANAKGEPERAKSYWNTYYCQSKIVSVDDKLYGDYCKNRFCTICLAIRKADIINRYYPVLKEWENPYFVTLTVKATPHTKLKKWIDAMYRAFKLIKDTCNKRYQRGKGIKLIGIRSLECNFNPEKKTYNPHWHIIVPDKATAELLKKEWLIQWQSDKTLFTSPKAQYVRSIENLERDLIEIIKYGSKIFTEPDLKKKGNQSIASMIYANALDNIFCAMKGKRLFERFGFNLPQQVTKEIRFRAVSDFQEWVFMPSASDWVNKTTGETLTGYSEPPELTHLLENGIDLKKC